MKTVLHLIEHLSDFGGTPRKLLYLAAHNDYQSNDLLFVTYRPSPLSGAFMEHGARVVNLDTLSAWQLAGRVAKLARETRAVAICTHFTRPLVAGFLASRMTGLPLLHNEHSSAHYRQGAGRWLAQLCLPFARAVICNSHHTARTIAQAYRIDASRLRVLHNPVEPRRAAVGREAIRRQLGVDVNALVIGHVGGMIDTRDQATLLRAFQRVYRRFPQARLWFIGDGPLRRRLEQLAAELGVAEQVSFFGYTDRIGDHLEAMDIYVNPTLDEGFGIAVVEAMLARLPVVLADAGAHPELIVAGEDGLLYRPGDVDALALHLSGLAQRPGQRRCLGDCAAQSAQRRFAPQRYAQAYADLIAQVAVRSVGLAASAEQQVD